MKRIFLLFLFIVFVSKVRAQGTLEGHVYGGGRPVVSAEIVLGEELPGTTTDENGYFNIVDIPEGEHYVNVRASGFQEHREKIVVQTGSIIERSFHLLRDHGDLEEVVVTGTMKEISRLESAVPVEVFTPQFFRKNPTPSLFDAVALINGVQPQLNCNVCNTGDIHINGMEGPYTMILIDGMPIVSALSTVYGLNGIPNSLVERIEVVKGPAASLYGSEAMGGIINVITKNPNRAPIFSADIFGTSWGEYSADASFKWNAGKATSLFGVNYYNYQNPLDYNKDGFTDMTLQNRISLFNKWSFERKEYRLASIAARYVYEDRWGGQMNWTPEWRGRDSIYGESIYTNRIELIGQYQLPLQERVMTQFSWNWHHQDSWYGLTPYLATQQVAFGQAYWDKQLNAHNLLMGASFRYTYYDDNSPATSSADSVRPTNAPMHTPLPGMFVQDEWRITERHTLLGGYRYDFHQHHGSIHSPRLAYKFTPHPHHVIRGSLGSGFRVVNLFTEDHAALSGAREVVIVEALQPERSWNTNLNYVLKQPFDHGLLGIDITGFYSYFTNKIVGDFDSDPSKIVYDNLKGNAVSQGVSLNVDASFTRPLRLLAGVSYMDVFLREADATGVMSRTQQLHAPRWSGNFAISYTFPLQFSVDFTGTWNGPMRLPVLPDDYRPEYSPWHCIANAQISKRFSKGWELYGGLKNLFNFVPRDPIMRPYDPFNKQVDDPVNNPHGYTFDPSYNYASLQGIRGFLGVRFYRL